MQMQNRIFIWSSVESIELSPLIGRPKYQYNNNKNLYEAKKINFYLYNNRNYKKLEEEEEKKERKKNEPKSSISGIADGRELSYHFHTCIVSHRHRMLNSFAEAFE